MDIVVEYLTLRSFTFNVFPIVISQSFKNINKLYFLHISKTMFRIQYILYPLLKFRFEKLEFDYSEIKTDGNFSAMDIIYNDLPYLQKIFFTDKGEINDGIKSQIFKKYLQKNSLTTPSNGGLQYQNTTIWYDLYLLAVINYLTCESRLINPLVIIQKRLHQNLINIFVNKYELRLIQYGTNTNSIFILKNLIISLLDRLYQIFSNIKLIKKQRKYDSFNSKLGIIKTSRFNLDKPGLYSDTPFIFESDFNEQDLCYIVQDKKSKEDVISKCREMGIEVSLIPKISPKSKNYSSSVSYKKWSKNSKYNNFHYFNTLLFNRNCNKWEVFFEKENIKIILDDYVWGSDQFPRNFAINNIGGISIFWNRSIENKSSSETMIFCDILFSNSNNCLAIQKGNHSLVNYIVETGYSSDHFPAFHKSRKNNFVESLKKNGAEKIILFLDTAPGDDSRFWIGKKRNVSNYIFLAEKIIQNNKIGVLIKTKKFYSNILEHGDKEILSKAINTNRFTIINDKNSILIPPSSIAVHSDVVIFDGAFSYSAPYEVALAGKRVMVIDRENFITNQRDSRNLYYSNWNSLWFDLEELFNSNFCLDIGNYYKHAIKYDSFKDGKSSQRMGDYLSWLINGFKDGLERDVVMANAAERYAKKWGHEKVVYMS